MTIHWQCAACFHGRRGFGTARIARRDCQPCSRVAQFNPLIQRRAGLTLIELLCVIAVLAILFAILLPAVQSSRESARRAQCGARMRDVALGWQMHSDGSGRQLEPLSKAFLMLGPHLDVNIDLTSAVEPPDSQLAAIGTSLSERISCPSDGRVDSANGSYSFTFNRGIGSFRSDGVASYSGVVKPNEMSDGQSQTLLLSERIVPFGSGPEAYGDLTSDSVAMADPAVFLWYLSRDYNVFDTASSSDWKLAIEESVAGLKTAMPPLARVEQRHVARAANNAAFGTLAPPNTPAAVPLRSRPGLELANESIRFGELIDPPTSRHRGGVNVAMGDGSVRFIADAIDVGPWIEMGTRASEESRLAGFK